MAGVILVALFCRPVEATDLRGYRGVREYTLGAALFLPVEMAWGESRTSARPFRAEINEFRLFGMRDLSIDAARFGCAGRHGGIAALVAQIRAPVGRERLLGLEVSGSRGGRFMLELRCDYQRIELRGLQTISTLRGSLRMCARLGRSLAAGYSIGDFSLVGERSAGIDLSAFLFARATSTAGCYGCLTIHREGMSSIAAGVMVRPLAPLRIVVGYDDAAELIKGMIALERGSFEIRFGSGLHSVLGMTSGLSLAWGV